jgi:uncharacterized protein YdeI (YjbR/CyaY-like superfamily)
MSPVSPGSEPARVHAEDRAAWRRWLEANAATSGGIWLVYDKGPERRLSPSDITEEALCFGWIDSVPRRLSDAQAMIYVAPRKPRSSWSRVNKDRVERLRAAGLLMPAGEAAVAIAVANGAWTALDDVETLAVPDDLRMALAARPAARAHWDAFPPSARRAILEWLNAAKREETRHSRLDTIVEEAAHGRRANQWRQRAGRAEGVP